MLVKELYHDSLYNERSFLAHYLYHLLTEKKISLDDDVSTIDFNQADQQKVELMIENNVLGIHRIDIFSLKMNQRDFVFIYAGSREEAIQFYIQSFHKAPLNCHEQLLDFEVTRKNGFISFRNMRKEFKSFPAIAGYLTNEYL